MPKKVLLARPSFFIVNDMRRLMGETGFEPVPVQDMAQISAFTNAQLAGAVISLAVNSPVKEDYRQVTELIRKRFPGLPLMLATLVELKDIIKGLKAKFEGTNYSFYSLEEASAKPFLDAHTDVIIIHKNDIADPVIVGSTVKFVKKFFRT